MTARRLVALPLLFASTTLLATDAQGYKHYMTEGDAAKCEAGQQSYCPQPLRWWRKDTIFTLALIEPGDFSVAEVRGLVEASFDAWIDVDCSTTPTPLGAVPPVTYGGTSNATRATPPVTANVEPDNVIVFVRSTSEWARTGNSPSWIAITKIAHDRSTGEIVDADIEINDGGYKFSIEASPGAGQVDFLSMLIHEVGHFYGLDHSLNDKATMFATYSTSAGDATAARTLDPDDVAGVCAVYTGVPERKTKTPKNGCHGGALSGLAGLLALICARAFRRHSSNQ